MTTWDNSDITRRTRLVKGTQNEVIYTIAGVAGDTGGTLTTPYSHIEAIAVQVQVATGPAGYVTGLLYCISGKTVVVAYTNPADTHTVRVTVTGK
jgi:hypothetical protein